MGKTMFVRCKTQEYERSYWPDAVFSSLDDLLKAMENYEVTGTITKSRQPCYWKDDEWQYSYEEVEYFD